MSQNFKTAYIMRLSFIELVWSYAVGFVSKLFSAFHTLYGWICAGCMLLLNLILGYKEVLITVLVCVILDTIWGVWAQIKSGKFALSQLGREKMLSKWFFYASVLLAFVVLERLLGMENKLTVIGISTLICVVEIWSMSASALIVNPNMPFLRLFKRYLQGEIAAKLGLSDREVSDILDQQDHKGPLPHSDSKSDHCQ